LGRGFESLRSHSRKSLRNPEFPLRSRGFFIVARRSVVVSLPSIILPTFVRKSTPRAVVCAGGTGAGFRSQVSGTSLQVSGFRFQVSGFRLQTSGTPLLGSSSYETSTTNQARLFPLRVFASPRAPCLLTRGWLFRS